MNPSHLEEIHPGHYVPHPQQQLSPLTVSLLTVSSLVLAERLWIEGKVKLATEHSPVFCVDELKHALMKHIRLHEKKKRQKKPGKLLHTQHP